MKKNFLISALILTLIIIGIVFIVTVLDRQIVGQDAGIHTNSQNSSDITALKNSTFTIDGRQVTLINGFSEVSAAAGSTSKNITRYFGNEAFGDLDNDGQADDVAFLITEETGGSGIFYYAVAGIGNNESARKDSAENDTKNISYKMTNAFFVGDRIAPQSTKIFSDSGELHIYFAERNDGEPMTVAPSRGAVLLLKVTPDGVLKGLIDKPEPETRYMDAQNYIRNNISELSPVKAQLGGTFYVTNISSGNGVGTVSYEDGHNAYTADFTYTISDEGKTTVTSFVVRK